MEETKKRRKKYSFRNLWNQTGKIVAKIRSDSEKELAAIKANSEKEISAIRSDLEKEISAIRSDLEKEISAIRSDSEKELSEIRSDSEKELSEIRSETEKIKSETEKMRQENMEAQIRIDANFERLDAEFVKMQAETKQLKQMVFGIGENTGKIAEDYFYTYFLKHREVGGIKYEVLERNVSRSRGTLSCEYDLVLYNESDLLIIEVKYKFHPKDVVKFAEKNLQIFKTLSPHFSNLTMRGAVASFSFPDESIELAKKYGLFIFARIGKNVEISNFEKVKSF